MKTKVIIILNSIALAAAIIWFVTSDFKLDALIACLTLAVTLIGVITYAIKININRSENVSIKTLNTTPNIKVNESKGVNIDLKKK